LLAKESGMSESINEASLYLSKIYETNGNYKDALKFFQKYSLNTSKQNTEKDDIIELLNMYAFQKKENEILELKQIKSKRNLQLIILSFVILIIIIVTYFIINRNKLKQKTLLSEQKKLKYKAVIETQEKERKRIAGDLHDSLGQILSTAKLNMSELEDILSLENPDDLILIKNALGLIDNACTEVRNISHNIMPSALIKLGFVSAIKELVRKINETKQFKVELEIKGIKNRFHEHIEIALYRIIQEIINNMIKHSNATNVKISMNNNDNKLCITIIDNGIGLDENKINKSKGLGWKNIYSRIDMLQGNISIESLNKVGSKIKINIEL